MKQPTIKQTLTAAIEQLQAVTDEPQLEAAVLLAHVLGVDRSWLVSHDQDQLSQDQMTYFKQVVDERLLHKPLNYILGRQEFYRRNFFVNPSVLIPRPETEMLIDLTIDWISAQQDVKRAWQIADIGTGSGVIAISLALALPNAHVFATDISQNALAIAQKNAYFHGVNDQITFLQGSLLEPLLRQPIDIVVANLPYIPTDRLASLQPEVRLFEPLNALNGGTDGLQLYRTFLQQLSQTHPKLNLGLMEIDDDQADRMAKLMREIMTNTVVTIERDFRGVQRFAKMSCVVMPTQA